MCHAERHQRLSGLGRLATIVGVLVMLTACTPPPPPSISINKVGPIVPSAPPYPVNSEVTLSVTPNNPSNLPLTYEWLVERGGGSVDVQKSAQSPTFIAPSSPGDVVIRVKILSQGKIVGEESFGLLIVPADAVTAAAPSQPGQPTLAPSPQSSNAPSAGQASGAMPAPPSSAPDLIISSFTPKPEECNPAGTCILRAQGTWLDKASRGSFKLYLLVLPVPGDPGQS